MQKIVLQGPRITNLPNQETLAKIYKEDEIKTYLASSHNPQEIFIYS